MAKWIEYLLKKKPADEDMLMLEDAETHNNKRVSFSGIADWLIEKMKKNNLISGALRFKGSSSYAALPGKGAAENDYYYCSDGDGTHGPGYYAWNGSSWIWIGNNDKGIDKSLKVEGAAAEAAATGEAIASLKEDIAKYQNIITNASFLYINKKISISATQNNDGDATYVQKRVVKKASFSDNCTFYISVSDIINSPAKNAIVIRQFSNDGSKIKDIYVTVEQAKSIYKIDRYSEDCFTFDVILYPTMSGGLDDSAAIYSDVMIYSLPVDDRKIIINDDIIPSDVLRYKQILTRSKWNIIPDISGWERGNINPTTGDDVDGYQNARTIQKIPVSGNKYCFEYFGNKTFVLYVLCYTSTSYLKRLQGNITTDKKRVEFEMPSGTDYIRLSVYNEWASESTPVSELIPIDANFGSDFYYGELIFDCISTEKFDPHSIGEDKLAMDVVDKLNRINDDILPSDILRYKQVFSKSKWNIIPDISGWERGNINPATGDNADWYQNARTIKKIPISGNKYCFEYFGNKAFTLYILCYTSTKYIKRLQGNITTDKKRVEFEIPLGTDYIRLSVYNEWASKSTPVSELIPIDANFGIDVYYGKPIFDCISTEKIEPHSIEEDKLSMEVVDKLNSIKSEKVPSYYYNDDYIEKRINQINELISCSIANGDAFIVVADEHIDQIKGTANSMQTPRLLRYVREKTCINRLFSLGDAADGGSLTVASAYRDAFAGDIHHLCGNHEYFLSGNGNNLYAIYDMFNNNQNGNSYRHYYYVDDAQKKIRYIILSSHSEKTNVEQIGASAGYEDDQINWLQNTALNVQEDWGIIVFTHEIFQSGEIGNETIWKPAQRVVNILDTYTGKGEIIAVFQGEIHVDTVRHTPGGIPVISITCNKFKSYMENGKELEPYLHNRIEGTITEQAFDVVIIDRIQRNIHAVRIGGYSTWDDNTDEELMNAGERVISFKALDN